jgi:hypothetical protein
MGKKERIRETLTGVPTLEYLTSRIELGWRPSAIEWERDIPTEGDLSSWTEPIPYGLQVSDDCTGLVENPAEREIITCAIDMIVDDQPLSKVARELNSRGYRTRAGAEWSPSDLFTLLPRMIQVGPKLFSSEEWTQRRARLPR